MQAVCDWFGLTDVAAMAALSPELEGALEQALGGPIAENKEKVLRASPVTQASKDDPPFLIMHGDKDRLVALAQSEKLAAALEKVKVPVTLVKLEGAGHGGPEFRSEDTRKRVEEFFNRHLKRASKK